MLSAYYTIPLYTTPLWVLGIVCYQHTIPYHSTRLHVYGYMLCDIPCHILLHVIRIHDLLYIRLHVYEIHTTIFTSTCLWDSHNFCTHTIYIYIGSNMFFIDTICIACSLLCSLSFPTHYTILLIDYSHVDSCLDYNSEYTLCPLILIYLLNVHSFISISLYWSSCDIPCS